MRTVRFCSLGLMALALALVFGPAEAQLVLKIEDPALDGGEREVVDNEDGDTNVLPGQITALISENGVNTIINAISAQDKTLPRLVLDTDGYQTPSDSATLSLTDTDFEVGNVLVQASVTGVQDVGNVSTFNYFGDANNVPFEPGFQIAGFRATAPEIDFYSSGDLAQDVGSLTLSAVVDKGSGVSETLVTTFTMILQAGQSTARDCPPAITGEIISRLGTVGDGCVIQDAEIEDGDVRVLDVNSGFTISRTSVDNGDIVVRRVGGQVTIELTDVPNGDIEVSDTDSPKVTRNAVNGKLKISENDSPRVARNVFTKDMEVRENAGRTAVVLNKGYGTASLEVNDNETAVVRGNRTNRDIACENNDILRASENKADRRLECPKEGGIFD